MEFFNKFFKKDIDLFNSFSGRQKKNLIYLIIFLFLIIYYIKIVKIDRFIIFLILLFLFLIWKILMELLDHYLYKNNNFRMFVIKYNDKLTVVIKILLFIQKWKNPILLFLLYLDLFMVKMIRNLIYILQVKYKLNLTDNQILKIFNIYYFIIVILFGPIKIFFGFFYKLLNDIFKYPFFLFFLIRIISFILSALIFSEVLNILYIKYGFLNLFICYYVLFVFIGIIIKYKDTTKIDYINNFISTDFLICLRNGGSLLGIIIFSINKYKSLITLISKKNINVTSSLFQNDIEEGFYKYWECRRRNVWLLTWLNVWKEIKNRPSFYLYMNLIFWISTSLTVLNSPNYLMNLLYIKYKVKSLNIELPEDIEKNLNLLIKFYTLKLKLLLNMIFDIDNYIGNENQNYIISEYDDDSQTYSINCDYKLYNFLEINNFKVEMKKKDLPFYDPDKNMKFFDRLYKVVGIVPYNENPNKLIVYSDILADINNLIVDLFEFLNKLDNSIIWERASVKYLSIYRKAANEDILIENEINDWIIKFLKDTKDEWEELLKKEIIEERNFRLLNEIENLLLKK